MPTPAARGRLRLLALLPAITAAACAGVTPRALPPVQAVAQGLHCEPVAGLEAGGARVVAREGDAVRVRLSMGRRPTGGYAVRLAEPRPIAVDHGVARVRIAWSEPGPDALVSQALTRPCLEIRVPASYAGVAFVDGDGRERGAVRWRDRAGNRAE